MFWMVLERFGPWFWTWKQPKETGTSGDRYRETRLRIMNENRDDYSEAPLRFSQPDHLNSHMGLPSPTIPPTDVNLTNRLLGQCNTNVSI